MSLPQFARNALVCGCLAVAAPVSVSGQTNTYLTNGVEYVIADALPGDQVHPALSIKATGGYIVWADNLTDGNGLGISARRLGSSLSGSLSTFRVNAISAGDQEFPQVGLLNNGGTVFVWQGGQRGHQHIFARFQTASGTWLTPADDVRVNTFTNHFKANPALAPLANGNVAVVWGSYNQFSANSLQDVYAQVLSPAGQKVGGEVLVNQFTSFNQRTPAVAGLSDGRFAVAWVSEQQRYDNSVSIYARIFNAAGSSSWSEFQVNTSTNVCANPSVAAAPNGGFIVSWSEKDLSSLRTNSWDVYARAFLSTGAAAGPVARLNQYRFGDQYAPTLALIGSDAMAIWTTLSQDGSGKGIVARIFRSDLTPQSDEFRVNTSTVGSQLHPAIAADGAGRFLVAWSSFAGLTLGFDLYAQRYASSLQPLTAPDPPFVSVLSSSALSVTWPPLAGFNVAYYEVYADGAATPTAIVTNTWWTMSGLAHDSTHSFQLDYVLADGRVSPLSGATTNTTYGLLTWGGIPFDWMVEFFGTDVWKWPWPDVDSDGDGVSNLTEFLAGTCPTDAASVLRLKLQPTVQGLFLDWNTEPGLIYQVQRSADLKNWTNLGGMRFAPGTVDFMYVGGTPASFYRVLRMR
ncbi:MAG TPA: hypothetical protein P5205_14885 [Candidatus Paceibacterota bacterium]|nr:hypothetical protein [Verrucomicrobiota bacterium]HSA11647.1 hypothetical protein [Candidatus Paceibacterota bacterium]